jgi:IclR family pca regulon transcriptional regulator
MTDRAVDRGRKAKYDERASDRPPQTRSDRSDRASNHDTYMVPGLERGLRVLFMLANERAELSLTQIADRLGVPRSSVFRICYTLEQLGLLTRSPAGYGLGPRILSLGFDYLSSLDIVEIARPELIALRDDTGASSHLGVLSGTEVVYIAQVPSHRQLASRVAVGSRFPAHAMSMGRLLLSSLTDAELDTLYAGLHLEQFTTETPATLDELKRRIASERRRGYVLSRSSFEQGIVAVAAPVLDSDDKVVAAINISGPSASLDTGALEGVYKDRVCEAAQRISLQLGHRVRSRQL